MQHINTLIPRTPYHKAVFMGQISCLWVVYLCHHWPHPMYLPPLEKHPHGYCHLSQPSRTEWWTLITGDQTDSLLFLMSRCPSARLLVTSTGDSWPPVTSWQAASHSWPRSPLSVNTEHSENNGNDISSFLSGSNCNDQLQVACSAPHAPPCPQNYGVIEWKM